VAEALGRMSTERIAIVCQRILSQLYGRLLEETSNGNLTGAHRYVD
jgi:hypothetical protein